jgi:DNA-directed RNA polymerase specialized sigma24 family protein
MNAGAEATRERVARLFAEPVWQRTSAALSRRARLQAADVADVLQEVLLVVCRNPDKVQQALGRGKIFAWLRSVTRRKIQKLWGDRRRRTLIGGPDGHYLLDSLPARGEEAEERPLVGEDGRLYRRAAGAGGGAPGGGQTQPRGAAGVQEEAEGVPATEAPGGASPKAGRQRPL